VKALLDAHALLWFFAGSGKPSAKALACIEDPQNTLFVSPATLWEISTNTNSS
jgi:PIN domain nuclease of toxin-antitoxin system